MGASIDSTYHRTPVECEFPGIRYGDGYYAVPDTVNIDDAPLKFGEEVDELPNGFVELDRDYDDACHILALRLHLDEWDRDISVYRGTDLQMGNKSWLVMTDSEADDAWDKRLREYIDEGMEIPDGMRPYFNEEKWMADAKMDGRAHTLSSYDGEENDETVDDTTFYIYRQN
ncbi:MAG: hypothetical protein ACSLE8_06370 [Rhodococcus sp. (in: high G+C Gram-positive bacteria)]